MLLCHDLVRKHGGTLRVENAVGAGTTFRFTLPFAGTAAALETSAASAAAAPLPAVLPRLNEAAIALPPAQTLETLHGFALIGDIMALRHALDALAQEARWIPFVTSLTGLVQQFEMDVMRKLLEGYLAQASDKIT